MGRSIFAAHTSVKVNYCISVKMQFALFLYVPKMSITFEMESIDYTNSLHYTAKKAAYID